MSEAVTLAVSTTLSCARSRADNAVKSHILESRSPSDMTLDHDRWLRVSP